MFPTCGVESFNFSGRAMTSQSIGLQQSIRFGEDFELDLRPRRLRRNDRVLKLERIPLEILILLLERRGEIVSRDEIVARIWGNDVFLDTDNSIRGAIRKVRQVLKDDPETPRFIQTVTGRGYRFIAPVVLSEEGQSVDAPKPEASIGASGPPGFVSEPDSNLQGRSLGRVDQEQERTAGQSPDPETARLGRRPARIWLFVGVTSLTVVCILSLLAVWGRRVSRVPAVFQRKKVLAVLPFDNLSRDPDQEFFSEGLTEEMIAQVGKLNRDRLKVVARSSVAKYKSTKGASWLRGRSVRNQTLTILFKARLALAGPCAHHGRAHPGTRSDRRLDRELRPRTQRCAGRAGIPSSGHSLDKPRGFRVVLKSPADFADCTPDAVIRV
jgi:DNA-binding winged helix-turn-helix (wHTH) protein